MNTAINIDGFSVFIFLGVFLGMVLSLFFILKPSSNNAANRYQGFLLLTLTLCILEMVGYNSKTAFNNAFRKITGQTPSEFRNQQSGR
jgi:hypothetical protein